jgi:hypothetical protein
MLEKRRSKYPKLQAKGKDARKKECELKNIPSTDGASTCGGVDILT